MTLTKDQYTDSTGPTVEMFAAVRVDQTNGTIDGWTEQEITDWVRLIQLNTPQP